MTFPVDLPVRYTLAEVVGTGATARVYRAFDEVLDAPRAIKLLKTGNDPTFAQRLLQEARAMARVRHPNILQVYDAGVLGDGRAWIVMDLAADSLAGIISKNGPVPVERGVQLGIQILSGLQAAHDAGVIHRDVKPENVLLNAAGDALIADFGIAALVHSERRLTEDNVTLGTFAYMAPEQRVDARTVGPAADQFSAAATLYQALTAASPVDLFAAPEDSYRWSGVPKALRDALRRAMTYEPAQRFPSCQDLAVCLQALASDKQTLHEPVSVPVALTPPPDRATSPNSLTAAIEHIYRHSLTDRLAGLLVVRDSALRGNAEAQATVSRIAHALRGSGATYGFPMITERATVLEDLLSTDEPSTEDLAAAITGLTTGIRAILTQTSGDKRRILVAVGDPVASGVLQVALQRADRAVMAVDTVAAAKDALEVRPAAAAIIDLVLPDADGRVLLDDPRLRGVPTIIVASGVGMGLRAELMGRGASAVFSKPVDPVAVASAVASLLARAGAEQTGEDETTGLPDHSALRDAIILAQGATHPDQSFSVAHICVPDDADLARWSTALKDALPQGIMLSRVGDRELGLLLREGVHATASQLEVAMDRVSAAQQVTASGAAGVAAGGGASVADLLVAVSRMARYAQDNNQKSAIAESIGTPAGRVLLAEDDPATAALVVRLLGEDGLSVTRASDGDKAYQLLNSEVFDLLLLDVYLPARDGFSLLRAARDSEAHARTPTVMLTAVGDERQVARAFELGADDYVVKPFRPIELKARVRRLLRRPTD